MVAAGAAGDGAVVVVLQVQFIDKVVDVLMQLKFQQSRVCNGQFIDRVLDIFSCAQRGTHSANCAEDCSWRRRRCDQQRQFPQSRGSNPLAPDSVHPLSGEHS